MSLTTERQQEPPVPSAGMTTSQVLTELRKKLTVDEIKSRTDALRLDKDNQRVKRVVDCLHELYDELYPAVQTQPNHEGEVK